MWKLVLVVVAVATGLLAALPAARTTTAGAAPDLTLALDCDVTTAGVQTACNALPAQHVEVDVLLTNNTASAIQLGNFYMNIINPDISRLYARDNNGIDLPACGPPAFNCNPDFSTSVTGAVWACNPPMPDNDVNGDGNPATQESFISCLNGGADGPTIAPGATLDILRVHYRVPTMAPGGGPVSLTFRDGYVADETFTERGSCNPVATVAMTCTGASVTLPLVTMSLDCNPAIPGVQSSCMVSNMSATRDVNIVVRNSGSTAFQLGAFGFKVLNPDITRILGMVAGVDLPPCNSGSFTNCNPDMNQASVTGGGWACGPGSPTQDDAGTIEPGEDAFLGCFNGAVDGPMIAAGTSMHVATIHYKMAAGADPGPVTVTLFEGGVYNQSFSEKGTCLPVIELSMPCNNATLTLYCPIDMADVNNDNIVNVADMGITAANNGVLPAPAHLDQNFDGVINVADRGLIASFYSKRPTIHCP